jgi:hypothetical protein
MYGSSELSMAGQSNGTGKKLGKLYTRQAFFVGVVMKPGVFRT